MICAFLWYVPFYHSAYSAESKIFYKSLIFWLQDIFTTMEYEEQVKFLPKMQIKAVNATFILKKMSNFFTSVW